MAAHHLTLRQLCLDLGLARQGFELGWDFGMQALAEMGRVAELVEHAVYQQGSLGASPPGAPGRVGFILRNPPLRVGAFSSVRLLWDGVPVDPDRSGVLVAGTGTWRKFSGVGPESPLSLPVGVRSTFALEPPTTALAGTHQVRMELESVAIPPRVWFEFTDAYRP